MRLNSTGKLLIVRTNIRLGHVATNALTYYNEATIMYVRGFLGWQCYQTLRPRQ